MPLVFRAQVQVAIKNRVEMIARLLREPWSESRDKRISEQLTTVYGLLVLEPTASPHVMVGGQS